MEMIKFTKKLFLKNIPEIHMAEAGKKFGNQWIFKNVNLKISPQDKIVILGLNGSGKSTLLQAISGFLTLSKGSLNYYEQDAELDTEIFYQSISIASPYLELVEDFTLKEMVEHVSVFKPFLQSFSTQDVIEMSGLKQHQDKYIRLFSSGMKQRLKLTLAILADAPILLLDEPTTNLDATVIDWYKQMIKEYAQQKTIIVCSNSIPYEYEFCDKVITMEDYK
jgi:ABC-type multidrug transport system ATPase subunit